MTTNQLHTLIRTTPFRPLLLHLADGRQIPVNHPELIAHEANSRIALVVRPGDAFEIIDLLLASLEVQPAEASPSQVGGGSHGGS